MALVWNVFRVAASPLLAGYERLLQRYALDPAAGTLRVVVPGRCARGVLRPWTGYEHASLPNAQVFDFAGLQGRLLSVASLPELGHPAYAAMLAELRSVFDAHQSEGHVTFTYDTVVYYGHA